MTTIPLGEWLPDQPKSQTGAATANNVIARKGSYGPLPSLAVYTGALTARCQGAVAVLDDSNVVKNFAGDATKLYLLDGTDWDDVSRSSGGAYAVPAEDRWEFAKFGPRIVAANGSDVLQVYQLGVSSVFAALAGTPPVARHLCVANNFLVTGDASGARQRVQWSAIDDVTSWTVSASTQADYQDLVGGIGPVQRIFGYEQGAVVFQSTGIWRMDYAGPPTVFNFTLVDPARGLVTPGAAAAVGQIVFFLAQDGFYAFDGQTSTPIGAEKVNRYFFADLDADYTSRTTFEVDPRNTLLFVSYAGRGNVSGTPNRLLIFNWTLGRWSSGDATIEMLGRLLTTGYTLEQLDAFSASLDALAFSLDSPVWSGGKMILGAFDTSHRLGYFNGAALSPTLDTVETQLTAMQRSTVNEVWPLVEGGTLSIAPITRNRLNDEATIGTAVAQNALGFVPLVSDARYHRFRLTIPAGEAWDHAIGVEPVFAASGAY